MRSDEEPTIMSEACISAFIRSQRDPHGIAVRMAGLHHAELAE